MVSAAANAEYALNDDDDGIGDVVDDDAAAAAAMANAAKHIFFATQMWLNMNLESWCETYYYFTPLRDCSNCNDGQSNRLTD